MWVRRGRRPYGWRGRAPRASDDNMERTRLFRRPVVWILLVIIGAIVLSSFFTSGPSYTKADTSLVLAQLQSGNVKKAVIQGKEQTLNLDLKSKIKVKESSKSRCEIRNKNKKNEKQTQERIGWLVRRYSKRGGSN